MPETLKVIQITDPHLRAEPDAVLHGWRVHDAWRRVLDDAMTRHPDADLLALTGDLVDDESAAGYRRLERELADLDCPVLALAGNHDDPDAMQRHLNHARVHTAMRLGDWQLHALDSHIDASDAGRLGAAQLARLRAALDDTTRPALLFLHHPPVALGSRWLDAIGLHDRDALADLVRAKPHVAGVICGHAHQALEATIGHSRCLGTPSTMRQFLPGADAFALDTEADPGYRVIALSPQGRINSHIQRVPAPDAAADTAE